MQERAAELGGECRVEPRPGRRDAGRRPTAARHAARRGGVTDEAIRILDRRRPRRASGRAWRRFSATQPGLELVGEAGTGDDAVAQALELQPDVVLMDLNMPGLDGIAATRRIVDTSPHIAVLVLTMADNDAAVFDALRAGARGYLLKGADRAELDPGDPGRCVRRGDLRPGRGPPADGLLRRRRRPRRRHSRS